MEEESVLTKYLRNGNSETSKSPEAASSSSSVPPRKEEHEMVQASAILVKAGMRLVELNGQTTVGLWSDLDGPLIRWALKIFGSGDLPVIYLDADVAGVPDKFRVRSVPGDPVPLSVLEEMRNHPSEPWAVRYRMLEEMDWHKPPVRWRLSDP
jgi:hypothetical protein